MQAAVEVCLVFGQILVVDCECPVMTDICKSVCRTLGTEPAVQRIVTAVFVCQTYICSYGKTSYGSKDYTPFA